MSGRVRCPWICPGISCRHPGGYRFQPLPVRLRAAWSPAMQSGAFLLVQPLQVALVHGEAVGKLERLSTFLAFVDGSLLHVPPWNLSRSGCVASGACLRCSSGFPAHVVATDAHIPGDPARVHAIAGRNVHRGGAGVLLLASLMRHDRPH